MKKILVACMVSVLVAGAVSAQTTLNWWDCYGGAICDWIDG